MAQRLAARRAAETAEGEEEEHGAPLIESVLSARRGGKRRWPASRKDLVRWFGNLSGDRGKVRQVERRLGELAEREAAAAEEEAERGDYFARCAEAARSYWNSQVDEWEREARERNEASAEAISDLSGDLSGVLADIPPLYPTVQRVTGVPLTEQEDENERALVTTAVGKARLDEARMAELDRLGAFAPGAEAVELREPPRPAAGRPALPLRVPPEPGAPGSPAVRGPRRRPRRGREARGGVPEPGGRRRRPPAPPGPERPGEGGAAEEEEREGERAVAAAEAEPEAEAEAGPPAVPSVLLSPNLEVVPARDPAVDAQTRRDVERLQAELADALARRYALASDVQRRLVDDTQSADARRLLARLPGNPDGPVDRSRERIEEDARRLFADQSRTKFRRRYDYWTRLPGPRGRPAEVAAGFASVVRAEMRDAVRASLLMVADAGGGGAIPAIEAVPSDALDGVVDRAARAIVAAAEEALPELASAGAVGPAGGELGRLRANGLEEVKALDYEYPVAPVGMLLEPPWVHPLGSAGDHWESARRRVVQPDWPGPLDGDAPLADGVAEELAGGEPDIAAAIAVDLSGVPGAAATLYEEVAGPFAALVSPERLQDAFEEAVAGSAAECWLEPVLPQGVLSNLVNAAAGNAGLQVLRVAIDDAPFQWWWTHKGAAAVAKDLPFVLCGAPAALAGGGDGGGTEEKEKEKEAGGEGEEPGVALGTQHVLTAADARRLLEPERRVQKYLAIDADENLLGLLLLRDYNPRKRQGFRVLLNGPALAQQALDGPEEAGDMPAMPAFGEGDYVRNGRAHGKLARTLWVSALCSSSPGARTTGTALSIGGVRAETPGNDIVSVLLLLRALIDNLSSDYLGVALAVPPLPSGEAGGGQGIPPSGPHSLDARFASNLHKWFGFERAFDMDRLQPTTDAMYFYRDGNVYELQPFEGGELPDGFMYRPYPNAMQLASQLAMLQSMIDARGT